jgi:hypothetical protein
MGGSILVSKGLGFATSTVNFDYLTERIRIELMSICPSVAIAAYEPVDEGEMPFISLEALDGKAYRCFVEATKIAEGKASSNPSFHERSVLWRQLLELLHKDARLSESG